MTDFVIIIILFDSGSMAHKTQNTETEKRKWRKEASFWAVFTYYAVFLGRITLIEVISGVTIH